MMRISKVAHGGRGDRPGAAGGQAAAAAPCGAASGRRGRGLRGAGGAPRNPARRTRAAGRLQDRLHDAGDAGLSRHPQSLLGRSVRTVASMRAASTVRAADFRRIGVECEIAVRLAATSTAQAPFTAADGRRCGGRDDGRDRDRRRPLCRLADDRHADADRRRLLRRRLRARRAGAGMPAIRPTSRAPPPSTASRSAAGSAAT